MSRDMTNISLGIRHRKDASSATGRPFLLALFGVFAVIMLVALLVGLQGYRAIADERNATDEQRLAYGSLVSTVKAFDSVDAFTTDVHEGQDSLSMLQRTPSGDYIMRLYIHDGMLMQQYSLADAPISPENAHALFPTDQFIVLYEDGLLKLVTDEGSVLVPLMCSQPSLAADMDARISADLPRDDA